MSAELYQQYEEDYAAILENLQKATNNSESTFASSNIDSEF